MGYACLEDVGVREIWITVLTRMLILLERYGSLYTSFRVDR